MIPLTNPAEKENEMILSYSKSTIDFSKMEFIPECSREFPAVCYQYNLCDRIEPWHWHDQYEAALIEDGTAVLCIEGEEYYLNSGDGYFINSGALHSLSNIDGKSCCVRCVVYKKELVGGFADSVYWKKYIAPLSEARTFSGCVLKTDTDWQRQICDCIKNLFEICEKENDMYELYARELVSKITAVAAKNISEMSIPVKVQKNYVSEIKAMLLFIWQNYGKQITLSDIAAAGAVSKNECMLCFNKAVGISPIQYLKNYRLEKAQELILLTDKKISEIAELCGFQDKSYFTKSFREKFGSAPLSARKNK